MIEKPKEQTFAAAKPPPRVAAGGPPQLLERARACIELLWGSSQRETSAERLLLLFRLDEPFLFCL